MKKTYIFQLHDYLTDKNPTRSLRAEVIDYLTIFAAPPIMANRRIIRRRII